MNIALLLLGAFCGGVMGAAYGAIPSFTVTGFLALAGGVLAMAGMPEFSIGNITFGLLWGPHITFAGAACAASFAAVKRKKLSSAQDVLTPLYGLDDLPTLLVGGGFAVIGYLVFWLFSTKLAWVKTDAPGAGVFFSLMLCRLIVGRTGPIGECKLEVKRTWLPDTRLSVAMHALLGAAIAAVIAIVGTQMVQAGMKAEQLAQYPIICFGISALSLIFLQTGFRIPVTHHITYPAAVAFVVSGNILAAVAVGIINAIAWQLAGKIFNSHCDTYIDPPAAVIMLSVSLIHLIFG